MNSYNILRFNKRTRSDEACLFDIYLQEYAEQQLYDGRYIGSAYRQKTKTYVLLYSLDINRHAVSGCEKIDLPKNIDIETLKGLVVIQIATKYELNITEVLSDEDICTDRVKDYMTHENLI